MTGSLEISAGSRLENFGRRILGRVLLRPKICGQNFRRRRQKFPGACHVNELCWPFIFFILFFYFVKNSVKYVSSMLSRNFEEMFQRNLKRFLNENLNLIRHLKEKFMYRKIIHVCFDT